MTVFNLSNLPDAGMPIAGDKILTSRDGAYVALDGGKIVSTGTFASFSDGVVNCLRELNTVASGSQRDVLELKGQTHGLDIATTLAVSRSATALAQAEAAATAVGEAMKAATAAHERGDSAFSHAAGAFALARSATSVAERAISQTSEYVVIPTIRTRTNDPAVSNAVSLQAPPNWSLFAPGTGTPAKLAAATVGLVVPFYCDRFTIVTSLSFIQSARAAAAGTARQAIYTWNSADSTLGTAFHPGKPVRYAAKTANLYTADGHLVLPAGWYAYVIAGTSKLDLSAQPMGTSLHRDTAIYCTDSDATASVPVLSYTFETTKRAVLDGFALDATTVLSPSAFASSPLITWAGAPKR